MKTLRSTFGMFMFGFLLLSTAATMQSCNKFDKVGLDNATNLMASLSDLMGKATGKYASNSDAIKKVSDALSAAVQHAQARKNNKEIAASWKALQDELVNPFLARWKEKGMLDKDVVKEASAQVTSSLEAIKKAELSRKKK